ncbi:serine hydrolase domain-containing protein [Pseudonocardia sp. RS010]|uniref:serine hydrolase domain-containing protein n=1 Tax=Pseudonocardia sp. RS010 TaxID=3385979 RepID=UPI0039A1C95E
MPPAGDTHVRIASITKTMTAAVVVQLVQEGRVRFDDPVSAYVPDVPGGDAVAVADLLMMRSGLYGYTSDPDLAATLDTDPGTVWTGQETLAIAFRHPAEFPPGTSYDSSNTNCALLGLIVEQADGRHLAEVYRESLFGPVDLARMSLPASTDTAVPAPYSHCDRYGGSRYAVVDSTYPPDLRTTARAGTLQPEDYTDQNPSYAWAAGGMISTADDLATWIGALVGGEVFDADLGRRWLDSPQPTDPDEPAATQYGTLVTLFAIYLKTPAPGAGGRSRMRAPRSPVRARRRRSVRYR